MTISGKFFKPVHRVGHGVGAFLIAASRMIRSDMAKAA